MTYQGIAPVKTHRVYTYERIHGLRWRKLYFCGTYSGELDNDGFADVALAWTPNVEEASTFYTPDAWNLVSMVRKDCNMQVEVERIHEPVQTRIVGYTMDLR